MTEFNLPRRLAAEALGTALLVATVIGSGIMGEQLSGGNVAIALLGNTIATGAILVVLILIFGPISAHFNPVVSLSFALQRRLPWKEFFAYVPLQILGGITGALLAHTMFSLPLIAFSTHARTGTGIWIGEVVASFGLLLTILGCLRCRPEAVPYAVGFFITAGYWFTSSTSFANPAVTVARAFSDTFAGINNFGLGNKGRYRTNIWNYPVVHPALQPEIEDLCHPTVKPVSMVMDALRDCSHRKDIVLDPFGGSGTTLIAAEKTGRQARLIELDPIYCDMIVRRWEKYTGEEAILQAEGKNFEEIKEQRLPISEGEST